MVSYGISTVMDYLMPNPVYDLSIIIFKWVVRAHLLEHC